MGIIKLVTAVLLGWVGSNYKDFQPSFLFKKRVVVALVI